MNRVALALVSVLGVAGVAAPSLAQQQTATTHQYVVFFRNGAAALTPTADQLVQRIAAAARRLHPAKIEVIGRNDGLSPAREAVADQRAAMVAKSLEQAGIAPTVIARAGSEEPAGAGIAAHQVVVRFLAPRRDATHQVAEAD